MRTVVNIDHASYSAFRTREPPGERGTANAPDAHRSTSPG